MQFLSLDKTVTTMKGLKPMSIKLDELVPNEQEARVGDPRRATLDDEKKAKGKGKLNKRLKGRGRMAAGEDVVSAFVDRATVRLADVGHREKGLWALDTVNPNAWPGATEVLATSTADFVAIQEARVEKEEKENKEATAKGQGWKMSISSCGHGEGGGKSAGVAVGCKNTWEWRNPLRMMTCRMN